jgi:hypothetical protein
MEADTPDRSRPFRSGVLFGLGFSLPFLALFWGVIGVIALIGSNDENAISRNADGTPIRPDTQLVVVEHGDQRGESSLYVYGQIANQGTDSWDYVKLQVRLLDAEGQLVGLCMGSTFDVVRPGERAYFQVDCDNWDRDAFPRYERYEIEVTDASPEF